MVVPAWPPMTGTSTSFRSRPYASATTQHTVQTPPSSVNADLPVLVAATFARVHTDRGRGHC